MKKKSTMLPQAGIVFAQMEKPKRGTDILGRMPIAPCYAAERIKIILTIDRHQAIVTLSELIAEVLDPVEQHMPEIDTLRTRMIQRMPARPCTTKPSLPL